MTQAVEGRNTREPLGGNIVLEYWGPLEQAHRIGPPELL